MYLKSRQNIIILNCLVIHNNRDAGDQWRIQRAMEAVALSFRALLIFIYLLSSSSNDNTYMYELMLQVSLTLSLNPRRLHGRW